MYGPDPAALVHWDLCLEQVPAVRMQVESPSPCKVTPARRESHHFSARILS